MIIEDWRADKSNVLELRQTPLPGDEKEWNGNADIDDEPQRDVHPQVIDADPACLDNHEDQRSDGDKCQVDGHGADRVIRETAGEEVDGVSAGREIRDVVRPSGDERHQRDRTVKDAEASSGSGHTRQYFVVRAIVNTCESGCFGERDSDEAFEQFWPCGTPRRHERGE